MKKMRISIENPCHEDWQKMTPESQGRFCQACEKTVVDFSKMSDVEILYYFSQPRTEKVCGRFRSEQLSPSTESVAQPLLGSANSLGVADYPVRPSKQLLHFAYLLVLVLGVGLTACGDSHSDVTGKILVDTSFRDSLKQTSPISEKPEAPKQEVEPKQIELMGDTVVDIIEEPRSQTETMGKPVIHMPKRPDQSDPTQFMTGPYEHPLSPGRCIDTTVVRRPKEDPRPQPPKYIKGKVALPKKGKPTVVTPVETVQDIRIMGECVVPYEYEKPRG